jgi:hypothetical protein
MLFVCADAIAPTEKATKRPQRESAVEARIGVQLTSISVRTFRTHTTQQDRLVRSDASRVLLVVLGISVSPPWQA